MVKGHFTENLPHDPGKGIKESHAYILGETFLARRRTSHFGRPSLWLLFSSIEKRSSVKTLRPGCCVDITVKAGAGGEQRLVTGLLGH